MIRLILFILVYVFIVGCQTLTPKGEVTDIGVWDGKVLMASDRSNSKKWAYVTWVSDSSQKRLRVDVRAILDIPIATFLVSDNQAHLWLYRENKYYKSDQPEKLFSKLVKFKLDPSIFFSFLGHPRDIGSAWQCTKKKITMSCFHQSEPLHVRLDFAQANQRQIEVKKPGKTFKLKLERSKVEVQNRMFKPLKSSQFESIQI